MKAAITTRAGNPALIEVQEVAKPILKAGWVLIKVKALGLNRSELFKRREILRTLHYRVFRELNALVS